jgi:hypothetical protein
MTIGILIVYLTSPKSTGMFFFFLEFTSSLTLENILVVQDIELQYMLSHSVYSQFYVLVVVITIAVLMSVDR